MCCRLLLSGAKTSVFGCLQPNRLVDDVVGAIEAQCVTLTLYMTAPIGYDMEVALESWQTPATLF